jgi:hypothetical protein
MNPKVVERDSREWRNLQAVAKLLEAESPNGATYDVREVYFDLGQDWMWTTIVRRGFYDCQVLCPRDWNSILAATSISDLANLAELIREEPDFLDK